MHRTNGVCLPFPAISTRPLTLVPGTKSIVRLMHRSSVVLPELAGPIMPRICFSGISSETSASAVFAP